jgi:hypothetical protein
MSLPKVHGFTAIPSLRKLKLHTFWAKYVGVCVLEWVEAFLSWGSAWKVSFRKKYQLRQFERPLKHVSTEVRLRSRHSTQ